MFVPCFFQNSSVVFWSFALNDWWQIVWYVKFPYHPCVVGLVFVFVQPTKISLHVVPWVLDVFELRSDLPLWLLLGECVLSIAMCNAYECRQFLHISTFMFKERLLKIRRCCSFNVHFFSQTLYCFPVRFCSSLSSLNGFLFLFAKNSFWRC